MFDGHIEKAYANARLRVSMLEENVDYLYKLSSVLEELTIGYSTYLPKVTGKARSQLICLQTKAHPLITKVHARLYCSGKKALEPHILTMLDEEALAIAFMADGSRLVDKRSENSLPQYRLHTNSWSYGDCWLFKKSIKEKLDLEFNVDKAGKDGQFNLRLRVKDAERFEELIAKHVVDSFLYKLGRQAPAKGGDIVCSTQECVEISRNEKSRIDPRGLRVTNKTV